MRRLLLLFIMALVLIAAPVFGQTATPTSSNPSWIKDLGEFVGSVGVSGVLALIMSGGFVFLIYRTYKPMLDAAREDRKELQKEREERERERDEREKVTQRIFLWVQTFESELRSANEFRAKQVEFGARQVESMSQTSANQKQAADIMTGLQNSFLTEIGTASRAVNQHVTDDGEKTRAELQAVAEKVIAAKEAAEKAATISDLNNVLKPVLVKFDELNATVRDAIRRSDSSTKLPVVVPNSGNSEPLSEVT